MNCQKYFMNNSALFTRKENHVKDEKGNLRIKAFYCPGMTNGKGNKAVVDGKELEGTLFNTNQTLIK